MKGASKQISDAKNSTARGPRPPVLKFLDPPLATILTTQFQSTLGLTIKTIPETQPKIAKIYLILKPSSPEQLGQFKPNLAQSILG